MKKAIDGKTFNTDTATEVARKTNNCSQSDFGYCSEKLYITKTGNWFVFGEGGAFSKYARFHGDSWGYGRDITPLSASKAMSWLEEYGFEQELEQYFKIEKV